MCGFTGHACPPTSVEFSDHAEAGSMLGPAIGSTVYVTCNTGYSGSGTATCMEQDDSIGFSRVICSGLFITPLPTFSKLPLVQTPLISPGTQLCIHLVSDDDECLDPTSCSDNHICVNTAGAYFCLPQFDQALSAGPDPLLGMDGGDALQVGLQFDPLMTFSNNSEPFVFNSSIAGQYYLSALEYGPLSREYVFSVGSNDVSVTYDTDTARLLLSFDSVQGEI